MSLESNTLLFKDLNALQPTLSKANQNLVPILIQLFTDFKVNLVNEMKTEYDKSVALIKSECQALCEAKDATIDELKNTCQQFQTKVTMLEGKLDAAEAYSRKDAIIISGAVPPTSQGESTSQVVVNLIKSKLPNVSLQSSDINICHRLQPKRPTNGQTAKAPNIYVKLCRRSQKQELIRASKSQSRESSGKIFINESLTKQRSAVLQTLVKMKKNNDKVKGVTSMDGNVYVYTASDQPQASIDGQRPKDKRHMVNTRQELQKFCSQYVRKPLEDFIEAWPAM